MDVYPDGDQSQTYGDLSNPGVPKGFPVNQSTNLNSEMRRLQPEMTSEAVDIEMAMAHNPEVSLEFDPRYSTSPCFLPSIGCPMNCFPVHLTSHSPLVFPPNTIHPSARAPTTLGQCGSTGCQR